VAVAQTSTALMVTSEEERNAEDEQSCPIGYTLEDKQPL